MSDNHMHYSSSHSLRMPTTLRTINLKPNPVRTTRAHRLSADSQSTTENLSENTILDTPDLPPTRTHHHHQQQHHHHHHHHVSFNQSAQLASSPNAKTAAALRNSRKTHQAQHPGTDPLKPTPAQNSTSKRQLSHIPTLNNSHPLQSTPKRQKTEPTRPIATIPQSQISTRQQPPRPNSAVAPNLFFTTQRFKTPGKADSSTSTIANGDPPEPDDPPHPPPSSRQEKGKAKETRQISLHHTKPRTPSRPALPDEDSSSDDQNQHPQASHKQTSSSSQPHTPQHKRNPHIYGRQEPQTDGEMSLIIAETPMHHKNRQFRRGGGPTGKQKMDQAALAIGPGTPLSSQSLHAFDSRQGSVRRGSRASSIGSGHEALPHPRILPSVLCRHVRTDLPPSMRCRTLLSWCSQKAEHVTYTVLNPAFKPTRYIMDELPNPLARTLSELEPMDKGSKSKLLARVAKSALKNFIRGICENQVEISWGAGLPPDVDDDHEVSIEDLSMLDIQALPPHPQDLKNERKIAELNHWKTRMSYEDHARQYQLNRYGRLIERLTEKSEPSTEDLLRSNRFHRAENGPEKGGDQDGLRIDTTQLADQAAVLEFGRFLRSRPAPLPKSIDVLDELGVDWIKISFNIRLITEEMDRVKHEVSRIESRMDRLQLSSTLSLKQASAEGTMSAIESKILLSSMDGVQLCLKSLNLNPPPLLSSSAPLPGAIGKRDLLRTLTRINHLS
ncbi:hypothetical protein PCANC_04917 [Puccinia coronata f. sp. avenae]|uniref:Uncharacterized protein n=1 Tax=Puccinia coronata f. sp. avenae TaxID=200324 RepID=A0A2N5TG42_9BASI|nr:hypothetical protein PCASD_07435 [Puccinia coronata f. sp. avenae]PLW54335.1 hypothetical protein PCANC_04917 [Puccinia coronata f. sp. avenae]